MHLTTGLLGFLGGSTQPIHVVLTNFCVFHPMLNKTMGDWVLVQLTSGACLFQPGTGASHLAVPSASGDLLLVVVA